MDLLRILDADLLGIVEPLALVVIVSLVQAIKQADRKYGPRKGNRKDDHGRFPWLYPFLPFIVAGVWFGTLSATGSHEGSQQLIVDIGGHGAAASAGFKAIKSGTDMMRRKA